MSADRSAAPACAAIASGRPWLLAEIADLARLAGPVIVSRAGIMTMALVDVLMVGHYSAEELAYQSIAGAPFGAILTTLLGMLMGTMVLTSQAFGAGNFAECGAVWRRSLPYALVLGAAGVLVCAAGEPILRATGQSESLAAGGGRVLAVFGAALPAALISISSTFFLEGIRRPIPAMLITVAANVLNLALNWVLVWGHLGLPAMGAVGSAWATTLVRVAMAAALVAYVLRMKDHARFGVRQAARFRAPNWREQRRVGYGAAVAIGIEVAAFGALTLLAGLLGVLPLAAWSIMLNLLATIFMVALGIAAATGVRSGIAVGRSDRHAVARAGWTGLGAVAAIMTLLSLVLAAFPGEIAALYTEDAALIAAATTLIGLSAAMLIADGGQVVMANALRGAGDNLATTLIQIAAYAGVMVPLAGVLAFGFERGAAGLLEAAIIGSFVSVGLLAARFRVLTRS